MSVTQIDIDDDALERVMALSRAKTKKEAVNLALQFYADKQERAARIALHFEQADKTRGVEQVDHLFSFSARCRRSASSSAPQCCARSKCRAMLAARSCFSA